jgi:hypothetical protein
MFVSEMLNTMKSALVPKGTATLVKLQLNNYGYMDKKLVDEAMAQFENTVLMPAIYGELTPLEKLGAQLLLDTANISIGVSPLKEDADQCKCSSSGKQCGCTFSD